MNGRRLFIPEFVQTSALDCGPASLCALLGGFNLYVSYGRLREAAQTAVDGTSIDTLEDLANKLGLQAEQVVVPGDHIAIPEAAALPALAVVRLSTGLTHFVVIWSVHGGRFQVMDPASGRRWSRVNEFEKELYTHEMVVPAAAWREFAESKDFSDALRARMTRLGMTPDEASAVIRASLNDSGWRSVATTDAAVRMLRAFDRCGALPRRSPIAGKFGALSKTHSPAYRSLRTLLQRSRESSEEQLDALIPPDYWSIRPSQTAEELIVRGAVLVRVKGRSESTVDLTALPAEVAAAATERRPEPVKELWQMLLRDGALTPSILAAAFAVSSLGVVIQALLFRALIQGGPEFAARGQRLGAVVTILVLLSILLVIDVPSFSSLIAAGRRLEARFRVAFLDKLPRIADRYFHSRLMSDMAGRAHSAHNIRALPPIAGQMLRYAFELILTAAAVVWLDPHLWLLAVVSGAVAIGMPLVAQPLLAERELRFRVHGAALSRFYFDGLLGLVPIRTHVADGIMRREHRNLLAKWSAAGLQTKKVAILLEGVQMLAGFGLAALLIISHISRYPESSAVLLLAYWGLNIPLTGQALASLAGEYPQYRNIALRLLEPLHALEGRTDQAAAAEPSTPRDAPEGVSVSLRDVGVAFGGHSVLRDISLDLSAGSHVAIIGPSGAGKSSLVGLLLGWHCPTEGNVFIDGEPLSTAKIDILRRQTAWIDPNVHLWNRSLIENLRYGTNGEHAMPVGQAVDEVGLTSVLEKLPDGLQTSLGDNGALLSGGEGERVRIGRALMRPGVRLVVVDEPFRGLDSDSRRKLLASARTFWRGATMLFVTHDIEDTLSFDRVVVMEAGAIVEEGAPEDLAKCVDSRYRKMLQSELDLKRRLLDETVWRQLQMRDGILTAGANDSPPTGERVSKRPAGPDISAGEMTA